MVSLQLTRMPLSRLELLFKRAFDLVLASLALLLCTPVLVVAALLIKLDSRPRPHALSHDRDYERRIALYARRHNVKPGITGWAQIHGYRGETDTDEKMEKRVEHDLYYIDNWSLMLDFQILIRTVLSPATYRNAY
jgi:lipopolysaccharide/colanic/teichoic acid biosynthesis glycosyltransferase